MEKLIFPIVPNPTPGVPSKYITFREGIVANVERGSIKKPFHDRKGYMRMNLYEKDFKLNASIHRMVLSTYNPVPNYQNLEVNHIDGNKENNNLENLEWCTRQENEIHVVKTGLHRSVGRKINSEEARTIGELFMQGATLSEIQEVVPNATYIIVNKLVRGYRWSKEFTEDELDKMKHMIIRKGSTTIENIGGDNQSPKK